MKIAILTWFHYINYGTVLQAYALQKFLKNSGYDVEDLNYIPYSGEQHMPLSINTVVNRINRKVHSVMLSKRYGKQIKRRSEMFREWILTNIQLTTSINKEDLDTIEKKYDMFICGSDQIWHSSCVEHFEKEYFLSFVTDIEKKIAYAPSFGQDHVDVRLVPLLRQLLSGFNFISVRERTGAKIVEQIIGVYPEVVADPTLLLDAQTWESVASDAGKNAEAYVFCYMLGNNKKHISAIDQFAKEKELPVKTIPMKWESYFIRGEKIIDASPADFVAYIKNAKYVITDSFHAVIFSLIFNKQFYAFERFKAKNSQSENSRIHDMLSFVGLNHRVIPYESHRIHSCPDIDFCNVNKRLHKLIFDSICYLKKALEITK